MHCEVMERMGRTNPSTLHFLLNKTCPSAGMGLQLQVVALCLTGGCLNRDTVFNEAKNFDDFITHFILEYLLSTISVIQNIRRRI